MSALPADSEWMRLDEAADRLKVPRQALADHLRRQGREVKRFEQDGRWTTLVHRSDLGLETTASPPPAPDASIWAQLKELEARSQAMAEHLERAQREAANARAVAALLEAEREAFHAALSEAQAHRQSAESAARRESQLRHEFERRLADEKAARAAVEREMETLREIEATRERYCDRLEKALRGRRRAS